MRLYINIYYYIRFGFFKWGFADLYAKRWNEIWEIKRVTEKHKNGLNQLQKYINGIPGTNPGRNLGSFETYYISRIGIYKVVIISNSSDGMIYYDYSYCWKTNAFILMAATSIALIVSGVGAPAGASMLGGVLVFS